MRRALAQNPQRCGNLAEIARPQSAEGHCVHNPRKKTSIFADAAFRVNSGAANIAAVARAIGGAITCDPERWQRHRCQLFADARASAGSAAQQERHVRAQGETDPLSIGRGSSHPQAVERKQHARPRPSCRRPSRPRSGCASSPRCRRPREDVSCLSAAAAPNARGRPRAPRPPRSVVRRNAPSSRRVSVIVSPASIATITSRAGDSRRHDGRSRAGRD
jgi:hypothetical protein